MNLGAGSAPVSACKFPNAAAKTAAIKDFLTKHGDDLPAEVIKKASATDQHRRWTLYCDGNGVAAGMRYEQNDWYLCTLKNAAVRPDLRGKGIGRVLYKQTADSALKDKGCLVLAADVTYDNKPSVKALMRAGFNTVNRFCWAKGQKPANVMHMVKLPTKGGSCT